MPQLAATSVICRLSLAINLIMCVPCCRICQGCLQQASVGYARRAPASRCKGSCLAGSWKLPWKLQSTARPLRGTHPCIWLHALDAVLMSGCAAQNLLAGWLCGMSDPVLSGSFYQCCHGLSGSAKRCMSDILQMCRQRRRSCFRDCCLQAAILSVLFLHLAGKLTWLELSRLPSCC